MACDSAYGAYLKAYHPYEFYLTQLKLYTEKKDRDKIAALVTEMRNYAGIRLTTGLFGQDNRDWLVDKKNKTISQSLSAIKFISAKSAQELYECGKNQYNTFTDLLFRISHNTHVDTRQIQILIGLGYFSDFGGSKNLMKVYNEFFEGKNRITKTLTAKSINTRLEILRNFESLLSLNGCEDIDPLDKLRLEHDSMGMCLSIFPEMNQEKYDNLYYVIDVESQYGIKVKLHSVRRGTTGVIKIRRDIFEKTPVEIGQGFYMDKFAKRQRFKRKTLEPTNINEAPKIISIPIKNEFDIWVSDYKTTQTC